MKMDIEHVVNELTLDKIYSKLNEHSITSDNLDEKLREFLGDEYFYARELNKKGNRYNKELNMIKEKYETSTEDKLMYLNNIQTKDYFMINNIYKELSNISILEFENIVKNIDSDDKFDIFLSHSMIDKLLVFGVYLILTEDLSMKVYVDWIIDPFLSETRSRVAIRNIRLLQIRMRQSINLNLLKTKNYSVSKWIAWEIGYFNGLSNNLYVLHIKGKGYDDDKSGMGFLKIYQNLYLEGNSLYYIEHGNKVRMK